MTFLSAFAKLFFAKRVKVTDAESSLNVVIDPKQSTKHFELDGKRVKLFAVEE